MAKAQRKQYVSKGQRRNSRIKRKHAIICTATEYGTAMREAFINSTVERTETGMALAGKVVIAIGQKSGLLKLGRGWAANLSPKTVRKLVEQGVFA